MHRQHLGGGGGGGGGRVFNICFGEQGSIIISLGISVSVLSYKLGGYGSTSWGHTSHKIISS